MPARKNRKKQRRATPAPRLLGLSLVQRIRIQSLKNKGWNKSFVARSTGLAYHTVQKYWDDLHNEPRLPRRKLDDYHDEVLALYSECRNCSVVRDRLEARHHPGIGIRTYQNFIKLHRNELKLSEFEQIKAPHYVEHCPGEFLQIDYGLKKMVISCTITPVHFFVAAFPYSKRFYVFVTEAETQEDWLRGCEATFRYFNARPKFIVCDNAKALVRVPAPPNSHSAKFTERFNSFCTYWGVMPIACHPHYPQAKGFVERMVRYVKDNALNDGYRFDSFSHLQDWLDNYWIPKIADQRHLHSKESPVDRWLIEKKKLQPLDDRPDFLDIRELFRKVNPKGVVQVDNQLYQLPLAYAKKEVTVKIKNNKLWFYYRNELVTELNSTDVIKPIKILESQSISDVKFGAKDLEQYSSRYEGSTLDWQNRSGGTYDGK